MSPWARLLRTLALVRLYWGTPDHDWETIALLMRFQIARTRRHVTRHQRHEDWGRDVDTMLRTERVLSDMIDPPPSWRSIDDAIANEQELGRLIGNHLTDWWD